MLRTVPERTYKFAPRGEFGILEAYERALRSAQHLIYLENQFLWSTEIVQILVDKLRNPPTEEFRILLLLPAKSKRLIRLEMLADLPSSPSSASPSSPWRCTRPC